MKLFFHPGTNMAQAMAETVNYVNRARAFMPPGTVPPFVMRFDTGSVPVGYLVLSSETRSIGEIQDLALFRVRPMFASLPGVSAPPPFGGNQRTVVITVDPQRLRAYDMTPDDIVNALAQGNAISPSGNLPLDGKYPFVPVNSVVRNVRDLETIPLRTGPKAPVYIQDVGYVQDSTDFPTGYALVNGRRSVYILVTKRADASTLSVVSAVKAALPDMQAVLPPDIHVSYEFDQSPYVTRAIWGVVERRGVGGRAGGADDPVVPARLAERDHRLVEHPAGADGGGGGALAQRADDQPDDPGRTWPWPSAFWWTKRRWRSRTSTRQMEHAPSIARAVRLGNAQTAIPRLLAMVCILAVFISSFFMQGAPRAMFVPLSLAVGFSMVASYLLSSTFVPVLSVWLLRHVHLDGASADAAPVGAADGSLRHRRLFPLGWLRVLSFDRFRRGYERLLARIVRFRWGLVAAYLVVSLAIIWGLGSRLGTEIFPTIDTGQFRLRMRAPDGTDIDRTEQVALKALEVIKDGRGSGQRADDLGIPRHDSLHLPDQHRVSMDARAGGRRDVGGLEAGKRHPHRAVQGGTPRETGPGPAGRAVLLRAGRHHQRGDELRLVHAGGSGRQRPGFQPDPPLRGESQGRDGEDFRAAGPASRPVARLPHDPSGRGPQEGGNGVRHAGRCLAVLGRGHLLQPLHRAELLGRSEDRHRLPGASGSAARRWCARRRGSGRWRRSPICRWFRSNATPPARSSCGTWPPSPPEPCPAKSTATTCDAR